MEQEGSVFLLTPSCVANQMAPQRTIFRCCCFGAGDQFQGLVLSSQALLTIKLNPQPPPKNNFLKRYLFERFFKNSRFLLL